jgi:hypothetical protein
VPGQTGARLGDQAHFAVAARPAEWVLSSFHFSNGLRPSREVPKCAMDLG